MAGVAAAANSWSTTWKPIAAALDRMLALTGGQRTVPVLVEDGHVTQIGWQGRGCVVGGESSNDERPIHSRSRRGAGRRISALRVPPGARQYATGWVLNAEEGVEIHLEGAEPALTPSCAIWSEPPPAAQHHRHRRSLRRRPPD